MDHRLGYPAVLRALYGAPAARALPVYAAWPPIGGTTEGDKAKTAEHDAKNAPKPVKRDEPYRPEGFDFQYVDRKGHQGEVIPKRTELDPGRVMPEDVHGSCLTDVPEGATHRGPAPSRLFYRAMGETVEFWSNGRWKLSCCDVETLDEAELFERLPQPAAPTEWQPGPPSERGWYASSCSSTVDDTVLVSFWNGDRFTHFTAVSCGPIGSCDDDGWTKCWRGPRLTGEAWPEPQQ